MAFVFIFIVSVIGCVLGCLFTPPVEATTTISFYKKTKPWGFWKPIVKKIQDTDVSFIPNKNFKRDLVNVLIGIAWQMSMVVMPLYLAFRQWQNFSICVVVLLATSMFLKFNWYNKLAEE